MHRLKKQKTHFSDPFLRKITIKGLFFSEMGQKEGPFFLVCRLFKELKNGIDILRV